MSSGHIVVPDGSIIRPVERADLAFTARAHVRLLPVGLFPSMGERFLRRWHRTFLRVPYGIALVAADSEAGEGQALGFLLGTTDQAGHTDALLRDRRVLLKLMASGVLALIRRPTLAARFLRTRGRPWMRKLWRRHGAAARQPGDRPRAAVAVLAAVAVEPGARGRGVGAALVRRFLAEARAGGADLAELVTVVPAEDGAGATFYERLGWLPTGDRRTRDGTNVRTYVYALASPGQPPVHGQETKREGV